MSEQIITAMEYEEFQSLVDAYIERSSREYGEMPASVFFELLFERISEDTTKSSILGKDATDDEKAAHV